MLCATFSPDCKVVKNISDHIKMPVVSRSEPPLQENPSNGTSCGPNHSFPLFFNTY